MSEKQLSVFVVDVAIGILACLRIFNHSFLGSLYNRNMNTIGGYSLLNSSKSNLIISELRFCKQYMDIF